MGRNASLASLFRRCACIFSQDQLQAWTLGLSGIRDFAETGRYGILNRDGRIIRA
jgi:hypothetical protein